MPGRKFRVVAILGATLITSALVMPSAHAQIAKTADTSATITGGVLTLTDIAVPAFEARAITGDAQTTTSSVGSYTVTDLRGGVGGGWTLSAQADQFTTADGTAALPAGSLNMAAPTVAPADATNPALPPLLTLAATGHTLDNGGAIIASAAAGVAVPIGGIGVPSGTGAWDFSSSVLTLDLPANVEPGVYESTVTMDLVAGP